MHDIGLINLALILIGALIVILAAASGSRSLSA